MAKRSEAEISKFDAKPRFAILASLRLAIAKSLKLLKMIIFFGFLIKKNQNGKIFCKKFCQKNHN